MCLYCATHEDGERTPLMPNENFRNLPNNPKAQELTVNNLKLRSKYVSFPKLIEKLNDYKWKGIQCLTTETYKVDHQGIYFKYNENDMLSEREFLHRFEKFKKEAFLSWQYPATENERKVILDDLDLQITKHKCLTTTKICSHCSKLKKQIRKYKRTWLNGHHTVKQRFASTYPGFIYGVNY